MRIIWLFVLISACSTKSPPILSLDESELSISVPKSGPVADQNPDFKGLVTQLELSKILNQRLLIPPSLPVDGMDRGLVFAAKARDDQTQTYLVLGQNSAILILVRSSVTTNGPPKTLGLDASEVFQKQGWFDLLELKSSARGDVSLAGLESTRDPKRADIGRIQAFLR